MIRRLFGKLGRAEDARAHHAPVDTVIYAVGDIHGRLDLLQELYRKMAADRDTSAATSSMEVFLGDYVDRGPQSADVIEWLCSSRPVCDTRITLLGNHEWMMRQCIDRPDDFDLWIRNGGLETMHSYGMKIRLPVDSGQYADMRQDLKERVPDAHVRFLDGCRLSFTAADYFFAHAGVSPSRPLENQIADDLLWIREPFLSHDRALGKMIVHGHTPVREPEIRPHRIGIDTGAYVTGRLTCAVFEGADVRFLSAY